MTPNVDLMDLAAVILVMPYFISIMHLSIISLYFCSIFKFQSLNKYIENLTLALGKNEFYKIKSSWATSQSSVPATYLSLELFCLVFVFCFPVSTGDVWAVEHSF